MPKKNPKIVERKLGRENAYGQVWLHKNPQVIEIDPNLPPRKHLEILCHEAAHIAFPDLEDEVEIDRIGRCIAKVVWLANYRRVVLPSPKKSRTPKKR